MKRFNLEEVKAGKSVITRDGRKVIEVQVFNTRMDKPVVGILDTRFVAFTRDGKLDPAQETASDLFMAPEKKVVWVNVYYFKDGLAVGHARGNTREEALTLISNKKTYIKTIEITNE